MPPVVAVVGAVASAVIGSLGLGVVATAVLGIATSLALGAISMALTPKPKALDNAGLKVTLRDPVAARPVIYGQRRIGGTVVYLTSTGGNRYLHLVITLAGHECQEIGTLYFGEEAVTLDGSGNGTGKWAGYVLVRKHLGAWDQVADTTMLADATLTDWTANHRLRGVAYAYIRLTSNQTLFASGVPNITFDVKGRILYDSREPGADPDDPSTWVWSDNAALCCRDYLRGVLCRDGTGNLKPLYGIGATEEEIDETYVVAAANACDELVELNSGSPTQYETRYTCNGVIPSDVRPNDAMTGLLTSMGGWAILTGGVWRLFAAVAQTATVTLDEDDLRGPVKVTTRIPRRDLFNAVRGTFVGPANNYEEASFPPVTNATYEAQDGGHRIYRDMDLPFTSTASMAQRLGKVTLERGRQQGTVELQCKLTAFRVVAGSVIKLSLEKYSWVEKEFDVVEWGLAPYEVDGAPALGVNLLLRETAAEVYDWDSGEETIVDAAPDTNFPDAFNVGIPSGLTVEEELYDTRGSAGVKARAIVSWIAPADDFVRDYSVELRLVGAPDWSVRARTTGTTELIEDIAPGIYEFRVRAFNAFGAASEYAPDPVLVQEIFGLLAPPTAPQNLTIMRAGGLALLRWDLSPDLDVLIGGKVWFRHSPEAVAGDASWSASVSIGEAIQGHMTTATLPLKPGTYLARTFDSSGVPSTLASAVATDQATILEYANVDQIDEAPDFSGTHDGTLAADGILQLGGAGDWDDIDDFDAEPDIDFFGGTTATGTYLFDLGLDLGTVRRVRLTTAITALVVNIADLIDSRTDPIDSWGDIDGDTSGAGDCRVFVRTTNDVPAGSPGADWGEWQRLDSGEFFARGFEFKAVLTSEDPGYTINVTELSIICDELA